MGTLVLCDIREKVAKVVLNRPEKMNALNTEICQELEQTLNHLAEEKKEVRSVILTGMGRSFSSGADLYMRTDTNPQGEKDQKISSPDKLIDILVRLIRIIDTILKFPTPIIASVNGVAAGAGANIALACDIVIASEEARLGQVFSKIGLIPDCGGSFILPRLVGVKRALELFFEGNYVDANAALNMGMINQVVPAHKLEEATWSYAKRMAAGPTKAFGLIKRLVYEGLESSLGSVLQKEIIYQSELLRSEDYKEGVQALLDKRRPNFVGR